MSELPAPHSVSWFKDRIGKTIYRDMVSCQCYPCQKAGREGIKVVDEMHAGYLADIEVDLGIRYRDTL